MAMMEDGKMVVTKVLICGGLVVVVAYGIYACTCRLRMQRAALRSYNEVPATEHQHNNNNNNNPVGSQVRIYLFIYLSNLMNVLMMSYRLPFPAVPVFPIPNQSFTDFVTVPLLCIFRGTSCRPRFVARGMWTAFTM